MRFMFQLCKVEKAGHCHNTKPAFKEENWLFIILSTSFFAVAILEIPACVVKETLVIDVDLPQGPFSKSVCLR